MILGTCYIVMFQGADKVVQNYVVAVAYYAAMHRDSVVQIVQEEHLQSTT